MLDGFYDARIVQSKVEKAFDEKYHSTFPDYAPTRNDHKSERVWDGVLERLGVFRAVNPHRKGFITIRDPMVRNVVIGNGIAAGIQRCILHVPEEIAMKILVLGELP